MFKPKSNNLPKGAKGAIDFLSKPVESPKEETSEHDPELASALDKLIAKYGGDAVDACLDEKIGETPAEEAAENMPKEDSLKGPSDAGKSY